MKEPTYPRCHRERITHPMPKVRCDVGIARKPPARPDRGLRIRCRKCGVMFTSRDFKTCAPCRVVDFNYAHSDVGRARRRSYNHTEKGRRRNQEYSATWKGKARNSRCSKSHKGRARDLRTRISGPAAMRRAGENPLSRKSITEILRARTGFTIL